MSMTYTVKSKQGWKCKVEIRNRIRGISNMDDDLNISCSQSKEALEHAAHKW